LTSFSILTTAKMMAAISESNRPYRRRRLQASNRLANSSWHSQIFPVLGISSNGPFLTLLGRSPVPCQAPFSMRYGPMEWLNPSALLALIVVTPWKIVGWSGSAIFSIRFFLQWIASERAKKSIIPVGFWECSVLGSLLALSYFAIYRRDSVGVLMTLAPLPLYIRNLYLKWREVLSERKAKRFSEAPKESEIVPGRDLL
jgi:lipid-A-disaccharide synthase-like uncharacterized protein